MDKELERCLECSECRKPIHTCYIICSQSGIQRLGMCADCPMLKRKLYGQDTSPPILESKNGLARLCCGGCGLTRDEVKMGAPIGCALCYEIFEDEIFQEIVELRHLPSKIGEGKRPLQIHIGKIPANQQEHGREPATTLVSLQKALQDTISREDYEQAAWLRDKIQALTKKQNEEGNGSTGEPSETPRS